MKKGLLLLMLVLVLSVSQVQAKEVNSFTVSDGQASYTFVLAETGMFESIFVSIRAFWATMHCRASSCPLSNVNILDSCSFMASICVLNASICDTSRASQALTWAR